MIVTEAITSRPITSADARTSYRSEYVCLSSKLKLLRDFIYARVQYSDVWLSDCFLVLGTLMPMFC